MARYPHHSILKLNKTSLLVRVRKAFSYDHHPPCTSTCSPLPLHITFSTHAKQQFLEPRGVASSDSSPVIGECQEAVDEKTICLDGGLFFKDQEEEKSRVVVEKVLGSLGVKKSEFGRVFREVMAFGRRCNRGGEEKKKGLKGLVVILTNVQTCVGERVAVHEANERAFQESKAQARGKGDVLFLVN
ncbi:hypothetical protein DCAR_0934023 [Daucus carota subsp. sativus]|uniref:Uncharacterized protein n=1 Tax=Daucus carota subsp. sativus TaxID=79200 RepID=A0A175YEL2_DAUCS|nr:hypothetical protein DCAR_0934023 [Daucus carota subsp. sativus]